jgi:hypothetical protein
MRRLFGFVLCIAILGGCGRMTSPRKSALHPERFGADFNTSWTVPSRWNSPDDMTARSDMSWAGWMRLQVTVWRF